MEPNDKQSAYQTTFKGMEGLDITQEGLRSFHIRIENLFDNLKANKSSRDFKWLFLLLTSLLLAATAAHIGFFGVGWNLVPPLLLLGFWIYYRWVLKKAIEEQALENGRINQENTDPSDQKKLLIFRIRYILNGLHVLRTRIRLIRNQYTALFPVFTLLLIHIIRGHLNLLSFIVTGVLAFVLGGLFWIFYFQNEMVDLDNADDELEEMKEQLEKMQ